jgi:hypothetical protein
MMSLSPVMIHLQPTTCDSGPVKHQGESLISKNSTMAITKVRSPINSELRPSVLCCTPMTTWSAEKSFV